MITKQEAMEMMGQLLESKKQIRMDSIPEAPETHPDPEKWDREKVLDDIANNLSIRVRNGDIKRVYRFSRNWKPKGPRPLVVTFHVTGMAEAILQESRRRGYWWYKDEQPKAIKAHNDDMKRIIREENEENLNPPGVRIAPQYRGGIIMSEERRYIPVSNLQSQPTDGMQGSSEGGRKAYSRNIVQSAGARQESQGYTQQRATQPSKSGSSAGNAEKNVPGPSREQQGNATTKKTDPQVFNKELMELLAKHNVKLCRSGRAGLDTDLNLESLLLLGGSQAPKRAGSLSQQKTATRLTPPVRAQSVAGTADNDHSQSPMDEDQW